MKPEPVPKKVVQYIVEIDRGGEAGWEVLVTVPGDAHRLRVTAIATTVERTTLLEERWL